MPYADPEAQKAFQRQWKRSTKEWFWELKVGLSCQRCGFSHPAVIQFHHLGDKDGAVSRMVNQNLNRNTILAEIDKCEVLCANCHAIEHYETDYKTTRAE